MAYTPNPNREIRNGKAMVSAKELADFQSQYGSDKTLRDLLNMDKRLSRVGVDDREPVHVDAEAGMTRGTRTYKPDTSDVDRVKKIRDALGVPAAPPRVDEAGNRYKKGGKVSSASSRADGIAQRGKTRGTIVACGGGYMKGKK